MAAEYKPSQNKVTQKTEVKIIVQHLSGLTTYFTSVEYKVILIQLTHIFWMHN